MLIKHDTQGKLASLLIAGGWPGASGGIGGSENIEIQCPTANKEYPISKANTPPFGRLEIPCWILDIQILEKPDGACDITRPD
ncbi:MAG: hypothetical protein ABR497_00005 [Kiritimatiellia bacterium]